MRLSLSLCVPSAVTPSPNVLRIASMFGLGLDVERQVVILPPIELDLQPGQVVLVTGASGGGKSTLLRLTAAALAPRDDVRVLDFQRLPDPPAAPLVDGFPGLALEAVTSILSRCGLNDAFVMLRTPAQLSDGQRYRLRLAQTMAACEVPRSAFDVVRGVAPSIGDVVSAKAQHETRHAEPEARNPELIVVLADEFAATLDRITACVLARNVRQWVSRAAAPVCFIAATTHDDLMESLHPDVLVVKDLGAGVEVLTRAT